MSSLDSARDGERKISRARRRARCRGVKLKSRARARAKRPPVPSSARARRLSVTFCDARTRVATTTSIAGHDRARANAFGAKNEWSEDERGRRWRRAGRRETRTPRTRWS